MIGIIEILIIEQQQCNHTTADCCICKIEYRAEKNKVFTTDERHPCGPVCIYDRKIEHIYHFAVKPGSIYSPFRQERSYLRMSAFIKQYTVKDAVNNVTQSSRQD